MSQQRQREQGVGKRQKHYQHGDSKPVRIVPVDSGRMRITVATPTPPATQRAALPQPVQRAQAPFGAPLFVDFQV